MFMDVLASTKRNRKKGKKKWKNESVSRVLWNENTKESDRIEDITWGV